VDRRVNLYCRVLGSLLVLSVIAYQGEPASDANGLPPEGTPRFFTHAEQDQITRNAPTAHELSISSSITDIESLAHFSIIQSSLEQRLPERVWGYGDVTAFHMREATYDSTDNVVLCGGSPCAV